MQDQDYANMGDKIQSFVEDAVDSMDFEMLNRNIRGSIQSVFEELNIKTNVNGQQREVRYHYGSDRGRTSQAAETPKYTTAVDRPLYVKNPPGSISGSICTVVGGIFTGIFGFTTLLMVVLGIAVRDLSLAVGVTLASIVPFLIASIVVLLIGRNLKQRTKRFKAYVHVIGKRTYCQVRELAASVDRTEALVVKDLQKMIENKSFPYAHLDEKRTCLMLNQETYEQYLQTQKSYQERALQEQQERQAVQRIFSSEGIDNPELVKAIEEGNRYIEKIRKANDAIPGEEISNKLFRLESLIRKIFEVLKQKPTQLPKLRKFMNYYMPTTLKLVQTYQELDAQPVEGENIRKSKKEIEETLDTINMAYEKLLDSFFEDAAMDITTDRSVLEAMFAQEGLTKNHFENNKEGE